MFRNIDYKSVAYSWSFGFVSFKLHDHEQATVFLLICVMDWKLTVPATCV